LVEGFLVCGAVLNKTVAVLFLKIWLVLWLAKFTLHWDILPFSIPAMRLVQLRSSGYSLSLHHFDCWSFSLMFAWHDTQILVYEANITGLEKMNIFNIYIYIYIRKQNDDVWNSWQTLNTILYLWETVVCHSVSLKNKILALYFTLRTCKKIHINNLDIHYGGDYL
jgi:hypothetical protein